MRINVGQLHDWDLDVYHCTACHRVVRLYDARNLQQAMDLLDFHALVRCVGTPSPPAEDWL